MGTGRNNEESGRTERRKRKRRRRTKRFKGEIEEWSVVEREKARRCTSHLHERNASIPVFAIHASRICESLLGSRVWIGWNGFHHHPTWDGEWMNGSETVGWNGSAVNQINPFLLLSCLKTRSILVRCSSCRNLFFSLRSYCTLLTICSLFCSDLDRSPALGMMNALY